MATTNNNNEKLLPATKTPPRYKEASIRFRDAWLEYVEKGELVHFEIVNMMKILQADGYPRMDAVKKIINDHNDLPGFSQAAIYRALPDDMKEPNSLRELKKYKEQPKEEVTNKDSCLSSEKQESINITTTYNVKDAETEPEDYELLNYNLPDNEAPEEEPEVKYDIGYIQNLEQIFKADYLFEIKNQELPLIVTVNPTTKSILKIELDKKKAKKLGVF